MTAIIGVKNGKRIMIGADGHSSTSTEKYPQYNKDHYKVKRIDGSPNCLIALTGDCDRNFIIKNIPSLLDGKDDVNYEYIVNKTIPKIFKALGNANLLEVDGEYFTCASSMLIATKSHLFRINGYGLVTEINEVACIGSGDDLLACKYLSLKNENMDMKDKIIECVKHTIEYGRPFGYPIVVMSNDGEEIVLKDENN